MKIFFIIIVILSIIADFSLAIHDMNDPEFRCKIVREKEYRKMQANEIMSEEEIELIDKYCGER